MYKLNKIAAIIIGVLLLLGLMDLDRNLNSITTFSINTSLKINEVENKIDLNKLNFTLSANCIRVGDKNELFFEDDNKRTVGGILVVGYYDNYDAALPNHSMILKIESIDTNLGKGKVFTLERSNPAASNSDETWNEVHAIIPVNDKNRAYDIWVNVKKDTLINILKSFH